MLINEINFLNNKNLYLKSSNLRVCIFIEYFGVSLQSSVPNVSPSHFLSFGSFIMRIVIRNPYTNITSILLKNIQLRQILNLDSYRFGVSI